ncbi:MAG: hypothetical protein ACREJ4_02280 [Candidatus Methylomirabilaceae bacterium]
MTRVWKTFEVDLATRRAAPVSESLGAWLRETLQTVSAGPVEVDTNLGGMDEAGSPTPDFDWVRMVAEEFPGLEVRVTYESPSDRHEAVAPYEVRVRSRGSERRAWVEATGVGRWAILEE